MESVFSEVVGFLVMAVEACGVLVIVLGVARAVVSYLAAFVKPNRVSARSLRLQLGYCMVMGLEFQVAADILKTALSPAWNDILLLAALIGMRTLLNYLLEIELKNLGAEQTAIDQECREYTQQEL